MGKTYELWDATTKNLIDAYGSEADALAFVRAYVAQHGPAYPSSWVLLWDDDVADDAGQIAEGHTLVARANAYNSDDIPGDPSKRPVG